MKTRTGLCASMAFYLLAALALAGLPPAAQAAPEAEETARSAPLARETISAGIVHSCGLMSDGTVACWGNNDSGMATPPDGTFSQVSAGGRHSCGLRSDGTVACWGNDDEEQLRVPWYLTFIQISAGNFHTCGLLSDGRVTCWGGHNNFGEASDPDGTFLQVSAGWTHTCGLRSDGTVACWGNSGFGKTTPPDGTFLQVSAGYEHTCGLRSDGTVACWGNNSHGEASPPSGAFSQVSAGGEYTCGLRSDGTVACWGFNPYGEAAPPGGTFSQVSAGASHTCGLRSDGTVACWGWDNVGQSTPPPDSFGQRQVTAGFGYACGLKADGTLACWGNNDFGQATPPVGVFSQVSAGINHSCGLSADGTLACWGSNNYGESSRPGGAFSQVSAGGRHSCGLMAGGTLADGSSAYGTLACWGDNSFGQLDAPEGTFSQVSAGGTHSCAVKAGKLADGTLVGGTLACWGSNTQGEATPPAGTFSQVSAGSVHSCGIRTDGTVVCWGDNTYGQAPSPAPEGQFRQVSAGYRATCGIQTDGLVACWGSVHKGGQTTPPPGRFVQLSAGFGFFCGVRDDGLLVCWGSSSMVPGVAPDELPDGATGVPYSQALTAVGGTSPYTFGLLTGSLPPGLELSAEGLLDGTPTQLGTYDFTVQVVDANSLVATRDYTLVVNVPPQVTADPADLAVNEADGAAFSATADGTPPPAVQWEVSTDAGANWSQVEWATATELAFAASLEQNGSQYRAVFTNVAGSATTNAAILTVTAVPPTVVLDGPNGADEGEIKSYSFSSSDPGGGPFSLAAQGCGENGTLSNDSFDPATGAGGFDCTFPDGPATSTVSVQVQDRGGAAGNIGSIEVTVANLPPQVGAVTVSPDPSILGSAVTASAPFSDAGLGDAPFSCAVDYGDGSGSLPGTVAGTTCTGPAHAYAAVGSKTVVVAVTDKDGRTGTASAGHAVHYAFSGFFAPVDNLPVVNVASAGRSIPVKLSLAGDQGLNIFAAGYPLVNLVPCDPGPTDAVDVYADGSGLSYDPLTQQYNYVWKTQKAWAGKCGKLKILLVDETLHEAEFKFK